MRTFIAAQLLVSTTQPEEYGAISTSAGKHLFIDWMPRDGTGVLFMASERLDLFLQVPDIEQLAQMVPGRTDQPVAIKLIPLQVGTGVLVRVESCDLLFCARIPQDDWLLGVFAAGYDERFEWMPVDTFDV